MPGTILCTAESPPGGGERGRRSALTLPIPVNSDATVYLPCSRLEDVYESGRHISQASEIAVIGQEEGHAILEVGSGSYHFLSTLSL